MLQRVQRIKQMILHRRLGQSEVENGGVVVHPLGHWWEFIQEEYQFEVLVDFAPLVHQLYVLVCSPVHFNNWPQIILDIATDNDGAAFW